MGTNDEIEDEELEKIMQRARGKGDELSLGLRNGVTRN